MKKQRFRRFCGLFGIIVLSAVSLTGVSVHAQTDAPVIPVLGSGDTGVISYGETVTGEIEVSADAADMLPIQFVGHNGANRSQGDYDVWYFDAPKDDGSVITITATSGDLIPTLLVVSDADSSGSYPNPIPGVSAWDQNVDGDLNAGACLFAVSRHNPYADSASDSRRYAIVVFRQEDTAQTGSYTLTLEKAVNDAEISGGSPTAICRVGTFVFTRGNIAINIRSNPGLQFSIKGRMQPGEPYNFSHTYGDWTHIDYWDGDSICDGYVKSSLTRLTGELNEAPEQSP